MNPSEMLKDADIYSTSECSFNCHDCLKINLIKHFFYFTTE